MSNAAKISARTVLTDPVHLLAFGFGVGLSPIAPGTVGSLLGVVLAWLTLDLDLNVQIGIAAAMFVAGTKPVKSRHTGRLRDHPA